MAQTRFLQYKDPVDSFKANRKYLGILQPGRYRGFDTLVPTAALSFDLKHDVTGIVQTEEDATLETAKTGILLTPTGLIVQEDEDIPTTGDYSNLTIDTNTGNAAIRFDLVICEHEYVEVVGGQHAQYSIVKGPLGSATVPSIPNSKTQILIGIIEIPAGATTLSTVTWTPTPVPHLGNKPNFRLDEINQVTKAVGYNIGSIAVTSFSSGSDVTLTISPNGTVYQLNWNSIFAADATTLSALVSGGTYNNCISRIETEGEFPLYAEIKIQMFGLALYTGATPGLKFKHMSSAHATGGIELKWGDTVNSSRIIYDGSWISLKNMGSFWAITDITYGNILNTIYETSLPQSTFIGEIKMWSSLTAPTGWLSLYGGTIGSVASGASVMASLAVKNLYIHLWNNFGNTECPVSGGRGANALADYTANKSLTLPNWGGRTPIGYSAADPDFNTLGKMGGAKTITLAQSDIPAMTDHVDYPAITGGSGAWVGGNAGSSYTYVLQNKTIQIGTVGVQTTPSIIQPYVTTNYIIKYIDLY